MGRGDSVSLTRDNVSLSLTQGHEGKNRSSRKRARATTSDFRPSAARERSKFKSRYAEEGISILNAIGHPLEKQGAHSLALCGGMHVEVNVLSMSGTG